MRDPCWGAIVLPFVALEEPSTLSLEASALESRRRSLAKALTWRVVACLITTGVAWAISGKATVGLEVGVLDSLVKIGAYYLHERAWIRARFGSRRGPTAEAE